MTQWVHLSDRHYQHQSLVPAARFRFPVRVVPAPRGAWADGLHTVAVCVGERVALPLVLEGQPLFTVRYRLVPAVLGTEEHTAKIGSDTAAVWWERFGLSSGVGAAGASSALVLPSLLTPGTYTVTLLGVRDALGCETSYARITMAANVHPDSLRLCSCVHVCVSWVYTGEVGWVTCRQ
jgi:hypothetical protein